MTERELKKRKWCIIDGNMVEEIEKIYPKDDKDIVMVDLKDKFYKPGIHLFIFYTFETELDALEMLRDNALDQLNDINERIADIKGIE